MTHRADLAALVADPAAVPLEQIPAAIGELERVKAMLWGRLVAPPAPPTTNDGGLLTLEQAAAFLGKSPAWLRRKAAAGAVPCARRVGRSWRFLGGDLERYVGRVHQLG